MSLGKPKRFPWVAASAVAAVVVVVAVAWLELPQPPEALPAEPLPILGLTQTNPADAEKVLNERLAAYDPTPLFLPTAWNSAPPSALTTLQHEAGDPFGELQPKWVFREKDATLAFPPLVSAPETARQGLNLSAQRRPAVFILGRTDSIDEPLDTRLGYVEITTTRGGKTVLAQALPPMADGPTSDWQPLELLGTVAPAGLVGELVVTASSGSEAVDEYFRAYLSHRLRVGERLTPGFYTFHVGP